MPHNEKMTSQNTSREELEKRDKRTGLIVTAAVHVVLLALLYFLAAYTISIPPPGDLYVEMAMADYGFDDRGSGEFETEVPSENREEVVDEQTSQSTQNVQTTQAPPVVTQQTSTVSTPSNTNPKPTDKPVEDPDPQISNELSNVLNQINQSGGGGSEGQSQGPGNEGNPDGNIEGKGVVGGKDGIGWELSGRGMVGEPRLSEKPKEEGRIVLDVYVDRDGKVVRAEYNPGLSNSGSSYLVELAKKAALTARFNAKSNAPGQQKGQMTFNFKLR